MKVKNPRELVSAFAIAFGLAWTLTSCTPSPPAHGTAYRIELETNQLSSSDVPSEILLRTSRVIRRRLESLDVHTFVEPPENGHFLVKVEKLPPKDLEQVRHAISTTGLLEFRMVHPESDQLLAQGIIDPGYEVLREERRQADGTKRALQFMVKKKPERGLTNKYIRRATVTRNYLTKEPEISFEFDPAGAKLFEELTTEFSPKGNKFSMLAIVLDGQLYSAPRINGPIPGGRGQISGHFNLNDARALANVLENPLEIPHRIADEKTF
jgi:preprotein translocase subunit SecD